MEVFLRQCCMAGIFALERGGTVSHLHLQVWLHIANLQSCMVTVSGSSRKCFVCAGCAAHEGKDGAWHHNGHRAAFGVGEGEATFWQQSDV